MAELILKKGKEKSLLRRHPWVYDTAVERAVGNPKAGDTVKVVAKDGRFLAWAAYSPVSALRARCWSFREDEVIDDIWFEKKIREAVAARAGLLERTNARRILFGEADGLPGLIVDQYGDWLVTQFQAAGVEAHRELIGRLLLEVTGARGVYDRSDAATRRREGLEVRSEVLVGETAPDVIEIVEDGVKYGVDVRVGHKTGFYIDQRESRLFSTACCGRIPSSSWSRAEGAELLLLYGRIFTGAFKGWCRRSCFRRLVGRGSCDGACQCRKERFYQPSRMAL